MKKKKRHVALIERSRPLEQVFVFFYLAILNEGNDEMVESRAMDLKIEGKCGFL